MSPEDSSTTEREQEEDDTLYAIPPGLFDDVIEGLAMVDLNGSGRVVLEKPFGDDETTACELWDEITAQRYGVEDPKYRRFRYGVQVNSLGLTEQQPENNVYRILLSMLAVTLSKKARTSRSSTQSLRQQRWRARPTASSADLPGR